MVAAIRPATSADAPVLSHICLVTGDAGVSAEPLHDHGELLGLVYAVPYVQGLPGTFGFVLEDADAGGVVGYVLGAANTRAYERAAEERWWPVQRARFAEEADADAKPADRRMIGLLHAPESSPQAVLDACPSHIHIDILPSHQRAGWGRRLIDAAAAHLKSEGYKALFVGIDPRNDSARKFYLRLGFEKFEIESGAEFYILQFRDEA